MPSNLKKRPAAAMKRPASAIAPSAASALHPSCSDVGADWLASLEPGDQEDQAAHARTVYLVTFSRLLHDTLDSSTHLRNPDSLSREEVKAAVIDALENPDANHVRGGRPRGETNSVKVIRPTTRGV